MKKSDRLLKKYEIEEENILEYISNWEKEEEFCDLAMMIEAGELDYAADYIVSTGAIDSSICYEESKNIEEIIECLATEFRRKSKKFKDKVHHSIFKDCFVVECETCNHTQFLTIDNLKLYLEDLLKGCWQCKSAVKISKNY